MTPDAQNALGGHRGRSKIRLREELQITDNDTPLKLPDKLEQRLQNIERAICVRVCRGENCPLPCLIWGQS